MELDQFMQSGQETKDNLGPRDTTKNMILLQNSELIQIEEGPTIIETRDIDSAFILGHPANAILGTSTLGSGTMTDWAIQRVTNPFDIFHEHFRETTFQDTSNSTNLNWDTTNFRAEFVSGSRLQTNPIYLNSKNISSVKVILSSSITSLGLSVTTRINIASQGGGIQLNLT